MPGIRRGRLIAGAAALATMATVSAIVIALVVGGDEQTEPRVRLPSGTQAELGLALTPLVHDAEGVPIDAHFLLTSLQPLQRTAVEEALRVAPEVPLEVQESTPNEFHVVPSAPLEPGAVYRFTFGPAGARVPLASWAFQVKSPLRVVQTLPSHEANGVPLDSGIEITFSHDNVLDAQSLVEISPQTEGHFEMHKRTLVFVPRRLQPETIYTVRMRPGATVAGSDLTLTDEVVFEFETGSGTRAGGPPSGPRFEFLHKLGEWGTKDAPVVGIQTTDTSLTELAMEVFAYPSLDLFLADVEERERVPYWAQYTRDKVIVDSSRLSPVLSFTSPIEGSKKQDLGVPLTRLYVRMPQALPPGYYLVQTSYANAPVQAFLQITDLATYLAVSSTSTLVWVNDVSSGSPVAGATVRLAGSDVLGTTDAQGTSEFDTPARLQASTTGLYNQRKTVALSYFTVTDSAGRVAVVPLSPVVPVALGGRCGAFLDFGLAFGSYDHWNYAVTDRPLYKPDDVVRFWGVALPRDGGLETELVAELEGYPQGTGQRATLPAKVKLTSTDWGTFTGEYRLVAADAGYYTLNIRGTKGIVTSVSFQVADYVKPAYRLAVSLARKAYFEGEQVDVTVSAAFFDGTPMPGLDLRYTSKVGGQLTTGPDGRAAFSFTAGTDARSYYGATDISVAPLSMEEGEISADAYVAVFPSAVQLNGRSAYQDERITVSGRALRVDPGKFQSIADLYGYFYTGSGKLPPHLTGAAGQAITATVTPQFYDAIEVGERYDFVNKVSTKVYRYQQRAGAPFQLTAVSDASGNFTLSFPAAEGSLFRIELKTADEAGRLSTIDVYGSGFAYRGIDAGGIASITVGTDNAFFGSFYTGRNQSLQPGEEVTATFRRANNAPPSGGANRYLFYESQRGIRFHQVQDSPQYRVTFGDRHVPSAVIGGVYFNGSTYIEAQYGPTLVFNPESRRLNIEVRSLRESYEPGSEAAMEVQVRDSSGRPVQAEVNLAAVDEALFALRDFQQYQTEILARIYQPLPSGIIRTYASHQYPPEYMDAGGRGGNGGVRDDFADVAYYSTLRTDASGRARVSFKLPDNVTSWRVTAYGFTPDLKAGSGRASVVASLPFVVDVTLNQDYILGDKPIARLRSFGTRLEAGANVRYILSAPALASGEIVATGEAFEETFVALPDLVLGKHTITVRAQSGALEDAVAREVEVVQARLTTPQVKLYTELSRGERIAGAADGRTTVTFMDAGRGGYYALLQSLRFAYGDRVDQALARVISARLLSEYFGEDAGAPEFVASIYLRAPAGYAGFTSPRPGVFQPTPRPAGVSILPYSDGDIAITARVAAVAPDLFGRDKLRAMLQTVAEDHQETAERVAIALYGLAALGEPVLLDLQALEAHPEMNWRGRLYVAMGLHALGDDGGSLRIFGQMLDQDGEQVAPWWRLRAGEDEDDVLEATALAAILAAGLRDSRAESLLAYVRDNQTQDILLYLEELQFLQEALPRSTAVPVSFRYEAAGQSEEVVLEKGATKSISLTAAELSGLSITVKDGRLAAIARYSAPAASTVATSPDISIRRSVLVGGQPTTAIPSTGLVQVNIDVSFGPQAPDGCYQVTDYVPSGLKVVTTVVFARSFAPPPIQGARRPVVIPYLAEPRRISFCAFKGAGTYTYYARAAQKGEYVWEPAAVHNQRAPALIAFSELMRVTVE